MMFDFLLSNRKIIWDFGAGIKKWFRRLGRNGKKMRKRAKIVEILSLKYEEKD
jgi:hypothetical protein